jgi:thymidylate synthase
MHTDYNKDGMSDFVCTNTVQYLIHSGKMHAVVQMRSNDLIFGYANDYAWQQYMLNVLINDYNSFNGVDPVLKGDITWQVGSLHLYERHFNYIEYYNYNK